MKEAIHRAMTTEALQNHFSAAALEQVVAANLGQDSLQYQFGHDHFHYDNNSFEAGNAYVAEQRKTALDALKRNHGEGARVAFGRLTHTVQDFYAHSNYVQLWCERFDPQRARPEAIDPIHPDLLSDHRLHSGRLYYPLEALYFVPPLQKWVLPRLPRDSHAWMNLDHPGRGPFFGFARSAAVARTRHEFDLLIGQLSPAEILTLTKEV